MARLVIETGDEKGREFKIAGIMTIGRLRTNPIPIQDPMSSREHTRVEFDGRCHWVQDLGSKNGTYMNTHALKSGERRRLEQGDKIQIGRTILMFLEDPEDVERRRAEEAAAPPIPPPAHPHLDALRSAVEAPALPAVIHYLLLLAVFAVTLVASKFVFDALLSAAVRR